MEPGAIYEEKISSKWITALLVSTAAVMLFVLVYFWLIVHLDNIYLIVFQLAMFLLFVVLAVIFSGMVIKIKPQSVLVKYGVFKQEIPLENIENCSLDEGSALKYGGSGIRKVKIEGKTRVVYNVHGTPRVVLSLKEGEYDELVFSTRHPDEVMRTIKEWADIM